MHILSLAFNSILNRKLTLALTVLSISLSIMLLLGVERLRNDARESFANTISGTDLIVGARGGPTQLLLYSVFRIGDPTNNVSWKSYEDIRNKQHVAWTIPLSLGDSHRGFRVLGTNLDYFRHYQYTGNQSLEFAEGDPFSNIYDAVIGADVAEGLQYSIGQEIILAHGTGEVSFIKHDNKPFRIVGILQKTGTPVDRTVHVSLEGIEAIHRGWNNGSAKTGRHVNADTLPINLQPKTLTAFLIGLKSRVVTFRMQRIINDYPEEPLLAVLPGAALQGLWDMMAIGQHALFIISALVVLVGISGMATAILTSLNERRREMAVLRSVGAKPRHVFVLFVGESGLIMAIAALIGVSALYAVQLIARPIIQTKLGLFLPIHPPSSHELMLLSAACAAGMLAGLIPAYRAYRYSLADGMCIRL
ncbi:ABC transporter permease [Motiliproteus sp. MSK22-1]|uniref:ABC transporter permease n=1 Tax=Motiliproteus sp. MSK22-1 TaxID=1897630 RepID=UPI000978A723|nr:ABC transporter permease [Motiliproteus sp. MSK22-1]OMH26636.1 peptide ABC transporter permease [Motiliproteus sp. MSK22-1]